MMKISNRITGCMLSVLLVCLAGTQLAGCGKEKTDQQGNIKLIESSTDVPQLIKVTYGDVEEITMYDGEINPYMQIIQFPEEGSFEEYRVLLGDQVKKGQIIATTENKYEEDIKKLNKKILELETEYSNTVTNYTLQIQTNDWKVGQRREWIENMNPEMEGFNDICIDFELKIANGEKLKVQKKQYMESAEKELEYQKQKLTTLQEKEEKNVIVAPCNGTITYLADFKMGDNVNTKSYPVAIADLDKYYIQCEYIAQQEVEEKPRIYAIKDGKEFELTYHPYDEREFQEKSAKGEGIYSFFEIKNPDSSIQFGDTAIVIGVKEQRKNVLTIPTICIRRDGIKCFVYEQVDGEKISTDIEIGASDKINTEIISGLEEGDFIYASN